MSRAIGVDATPSRGRTSGMNAPHCRCEVGDVGCPGVEVHAATAASPPSAARRKMSRRGSGIGGTPQC
ncbi:Uncharacterised protein [Mycobacteroides abscessus subsp. abscessus]|nr:Uncharacterised protein [Mycobacteroides abscessus subsp. abscessus]